MSFCNKFLFLLVIPFFALLLSSCGETKSASVPIILGSPPAKAYIDVKYSYEFGADGGDDILNYRIVSAPPWLSIVNINGAKPAFILEGVPTVRDMAEFALIEANKTVYNVEIEVSDGALSSISAFEIQLVPNKMVFFADTILVDEGGERFDVSFLFEDECVLPDITPFDEGDKTAYPYLVIFELENPSESKIEVEFSLFSQYDDSAGERDDKNIHKLRPSHDYIERTGTVVFEKGVTRCAATVDVFDDTLIEGDEDLFIRSESALSGWVSLPKQFKLTVEDDEPEVGFVGEDIILNAGESKVYELTLDKTVDYPTSILIKSGVATTAHASSYSFDPNPVIFAAGSDKSSFTVKLEDNVTGTAASSDEVLVVETGVSEIFELDPVNMSINEWTSTIQIPGFGGSDEESVGMIADHDGNIIVLTTTTQLSGKDAILSMLDRSGNVDLSGITPGEEVISSSDGGDEEGAGLAYLFQGSALHRVAVVATTTGDVGGVSNNGLKDVVVRSYRRDVNGESSLAYKIIWTRQLSTSVNTVPVGVEFDGAGNIFVFGYQDSVAGGTDAFATKYDVDGNFLWATLIESSGSDVAVATGFVVGDAGLYVTGTTSGNLFGISSGGVDGFFVTLDESGVLSKSLQFGTSNDDEVTGLASNDNQFWITGHSMGDFGIVEGSTSFDPDASRGSVDIFFLNFDLNNTLDASLQYGDPTLSDSSSSVDSIKSQAFIGGATSGVVAEGKDNIGGVDAVLSGVNSVSAISTILWHTQFGTTADDQVIDLGIFNNKVMALWETDNGGSVAYKLTPFALDDGAKLVP